ncbi:MAG: hypothetical protein JWM76_159 [Pseudonocardiales bacterium]|nr:hypothetical protein [Pseudonocardiales bacterium]
MPKINRRQFLLASAGTGGLALAAGSTAVTWHQLQDRTSSRPLPEGADVLVIVTLYGGNDGLNTLVPYADAAYHSARPELSYAPEDVLHLDGSLGLNPAMTGLAGLFKSGQLAIVRGVGYPKPDRSHFRSMDIWQTASPDSPINTGWIGRWLDVTGDDPLRALNIGTTLPPLAVGERAAAATLALDDSKALVAPYATALDALGRSDPRDTPSQAMVCAAYRAERRADAVFTPVVSALRTSTGAVPQSAATSAGGQGGLKQQLDLVAKCVKAGVPTRAYSVSLGGFDTHADEKDTQKAALGIVDTAVTGFLREMAADPRGRKVVLMMYSEFGRRVQANGSEGTDHGTAGPVFVAGGSVRGGFYGEQPSLTDLDDGDLKTNVDFRALYGELVAKVLGADPARVLGRVPAAVGFLP